MPDDTTYTIADLARLTGLNVRTIRYYIAQGLIPASGESGPGAHYGQGHMDRLRLTKRLQQQHLPLAEIRQRLATLTDDEVAGLLAESEPARGSPGTSALDYVRGVLGQPTGDATQDAALPPPPAMAPAGSAAPPRSALPARSAELGAPARRRKLDPSETSEVMWVAERASAYASAMPRLKDARPSPSSPSTPTERPSAEPQPPERSQWERLSLGPNIELHVRRPLGRLEQRRVERLITIARQVLKEDGV